VPKRAYIAAVSAEGETELNAFDNCLIKAGLPQVSLIKLTSILPPDIEITETPPEDLPLGANVPAIYDYVVSSESGEVISAAIAIGWTDKGPTLVAEYSGRGLNKRVAEERALLRLREMARARNSTILKYSLYSAEHRVEKCGCVLVIVAEIE